MHWILTGMWSGFLNREKMNRRRFIHGMVRGGLLASMTMVAGILVSRKQISLQKECGLKSPCRNCRILEDCRLPAAEKERINGKG
jgi:hypothetical protein